MSGWPWSELEPADLALVIALDGSASVSFSEFNAITGGIAAALRDPEVMAALQAGPHRASFLSVLLWSGPGTREVMVDWVRAGSDAEVIEFANSVNDVPRTVRAGETAIGEALVAAGTLLQALPAPASRRIIDVAGDGRNNAGIPPGPIRDRLAASGVTINGLCVLHEEPDLLQRYTAEVIGGPGAFALECRDYDTFADAMRRKLVRELS